MKTLEWPLRFTLLAAVSAGAVMTSAASARVLANQDQQASPPAGQAATPTPASQAKATDAEAGVQDIIVTAERRSQGVQRTAASVSVRSGDELRKAGKFQLADIIENVPGVSGGAAEANGNIAGGGTDTAGAGVVIRGLQSNAGAGGNNGSTPAAVAVYVDDIYEGVGSSYDIDRVEILRGPQGTLYGRSATGGVVSIHTRDPDLNAVTGMGLAEIGNYNLRHVTAALNVPVIDDKLAIRVSGDYYNRDGFDTSNGLGARTNKSGRIKILAKPTENLSILVGAAVQYNDDATGGRAAVARADGSRAFNDGPLGSGKNHFHQVWADIQWDLGFATLSYLPAYREWYQDASLIGVGPGFTIAQQLLTPKDQFVTNEARLTSDASSKLKWQVGLLSYDNTVESTNTVRFVLPGNPVAFATSSKKKTHALGFFGEATYPITNDWLVTGGLRYDHTAIDAEQDYTSFTGVTLSLPASQGRLRFNNWTYKIRTEYNFSPRNMLYAVYSTGVSPGDASVTTDPAGQPFVLTLADQTLTALEFGSKNRFFGNTLQVNGDIFFYRYSGYQNAGIDIDPGPNIAFATLVSPERSFGAEFELLFQPSPRDRLGLNLAYTRARFVNSSAFFKTYIARTDVAQVAPFTANLVYSHRFDFSGGSNLNVVADGRYLSPHDGGTITAAQIAQGGLKLVRVPSVGILNLNATWTASNGQLSIGAYVRNVTNNRYILNSQVDSSTGSITGSTLSIYAPRTFGGVVTVNF